ncbi:hypothetical protein [Longirhabdus pacifica]|uniref:hypothetical protein n=1 Tax=Longirhabdus pacifica TaxID=2305227 RepID=UPI001008CB06|nr:hypothetical protein [Longirhabdus pacifica]
MASPVYKREKQRTVFGIFTKRERNIIIIALVIAFFFIRPSGVDESQYQWNVQAVPVAVEENYGVDWGALPDEEEEMKAGLQSYQVDPSIVYERKKVILQWEERDGYEYQMYLNDEMIQTTSIGIFVYEFEEVESSRLVMFLRVFVLALAGIIAFIDVNGTDIEKYVMQIGKQYIQFKKVFQIPLVGLNISMPVKKQTVFHVDKQSVDPFMPTQKKKQMKKKKIENLDAVQKIEKVFYATQQPIAFETSMNTIEILHEAMTIRLHRGSKGEIKVDIRDKK